MVLDLVSGEPIPAARVVATASHQDEGYPPLAEPGSRLAFFQMIARFEKLGIDVEAMRKEEEKAPEVLDAEAFLKANPNKPAE